jgi:hypothetical protein
MGKINATFIGMILLLVLTLILVGCSSGTAAAPTPNSPNSYAPTSSLELPALGGSGNTGTNNNSNAGTGNNTGANGNAAPTYEGSTRNEVEQAGVDPCTVLAVQDFEAVLKVGLQPQNASVGINNAVSTANATNAGSGATVPSGGGNNTSTGAGGGANSQTQGNTGAGSQASAATGNGISCLYTGAGDNNGLQVTVTTYQGAQQIQQGGDSASISGLGDAAFSVADGVYVRKGDHWLLIAINPGGNSQLNVADAAVGLARLALNRIP